MKHQVYDLTGQLVDDSSIDIDGLDLKQHGNKIGSISEETLDYLIKNRKNLQIFKFVEPQMSTEGQLIDVKVLTTLKDDLKKPRRFRMIMVVYYGLVFIAGLISLIFSIVDNSITWIKIFFFLVVVSSAYLLFDYLNEFNKLERFKKK